MARFSAALCAAALLGQYAIGAIGGAVAQEAKSRTPTEAALNWQLGLRMDDLLACTAQLITLQQQLNADEQKIKELKSDLAEALALR